MSQTHFSVTGLSCFYHSDIHKIVLLSYEDGKPTMVTEVTLNKESASQLMESCQKWLDAENSIFNAGPK